MDHILSLSYGKDSLACLGAIDELGWPLDRIIHAEVWATDTIPADLPPMVEFKERADEIILSRYGIKVEHICATTIYKNDPQCNTFEKGFYHALTTGKFTGKIKGWPMQRHPWCNKLKINPLGQIKKKTYNDLFYRVWGERSKRRGEIYGFSGIGRNMCNSQLKVSTLKKAQKGCITYIGIAADEPGRFHNLGESQRSPLVELGWTESMCRDWCDENGLLSPIYKNACRGGCWFCHNQGVDQLRQLRHNYPRYWDLMLKWDQDSPVAFHSDGHTVHDYEERFSLEDQGLIPKDKKFRWEMLQEDLNYRLF